MHLRGSELSCPEARRELRHLETPKIQALAPEGILLSLSRPFMRWPVNNTANHTMHSTPEPNAIPPTLSASAASAVIRVEDVHKYYDLGETRVHALRGVSLQIQRGAFLAIMGASGSGKSTFMNMLGCLDRP